GLQLGLGGAEGGPAVEVPGLAGVPRVVGGRPVRLPGGLRDDHGASRRTAPRQRAEGRALGRLTPGRSPCRDYFAFLYSHTTSTLYDVSRSSISSRMVPRLRTYAARSATCLRASSSPTPSPRIASVISGSANLSRMSAAPSA